MYLSRGSILTIILLACAALVALAQPCLAASSNQEDASVTMMLSASMGSIMEGERLAWTLTVEPHGQPLQEVEVTAADPVSWQIEGAIWQAVITETTSFTLSAVPLRSGELWPQARVRYKLGEQWYVRVVSAGSSVRVARVEEPLQAELVAGVATLRRGEAWTATLLLRNSSPFTLTGVSLARLGSDLTWQHLPVVAALPPLAVEMVPVTATVTGEHPLPAMMVAYAWHDDAARPHSGRSLVRGQALAVAEPWWRQFESYVGVVLGALVGLGTSLATQYFTEQQGRKQQQRQDQRHVCGLLRLGVLQVREAAEMSRTAPLGPIESVYLSERGLYATAQALEVYEQLDQLYKAAIEYNARLADPIGATDRQKALQKAVDILENQLGKVERRQRLKQDAAQSATR